VSEKEEEKARPGGEAEPEKKGGREGRRSRGRRVYGGRWVQSTHYIMF
jgi:hypothetical protein